MSRLSTGYHDSSAAGLRSHRFAPDTYLAMDDDDKRPTRAELDAMLGFGGDKPDRKHAGFRLTGERLDPDAITQATGLTPQLSHREGRATASFARG